MNSLQDRKWRRLVDEDAKAVRPNGDLVKTHFVSESLAESIAATIGSAHNLELTIKEASSKLTFEPGGYGMYYIHQPRFTMEIGNLPLTIDCLKFEEMLSDMASAAVYETLDGQFKYIRLYSRFCCLVLSVEQRDMLSEQMRFRLKAAQQEAEKFLVEAEKLRQELKASGRFLFAEDLTKPGPKN